MKKIILIAFSFFSILGYSQYNMGGPDVTSCSGVFCDFGGATGNYNNSADDTMTFTSDNGNRICFNFQEFVLSLISYDK